MRRVSLPALAILSVSCGAHMAITPDVRVDPLPALAVDAHTDLSRALRTELLRNRRPLGLVDACVVRARVTTADHGRVAFGDQAGAAGMGARVALTLDCPSSPTQEGEASASGLAPAGSGEPGRRRALEAALLEAARFAVLDLAARAETDRAAEPETEEP